MAKKKTKGRKNRGNYPLTSNRQLPKINPVRQAILDRMKTLEMNPYKLAKAVKGRMTPQAVYNYLKGRSDMTSGLVMHLLDALGLEVAPKD